MNTWKLSEIEKEKAIENIVKHGVVTPADRIRELREVSRACPFRVLFFGASDCLFLGVLITVCLWLFLLSFDTKIILCSVFALSPFAYISSYFLTAWKEHIVQLYEVKMSCHYTIRQVTALRMMYFSLGNMLINTVCLYLFIQTQTILIPFWKTLGLSFSSLFLYGAIMLFFQIKGKLYLSIAIPPFVWGLLNLAVIMLYGEQLEKLFLNLAGGLVLIILLVTCVVYLFMLYSFSTTKYAEGKQYVVC